MRSLIDPEDRLLLFHNLHLLFSLSLINLLLLLLAQANSLATEDNLLILCELKVFDEEHGNQHRDLQTGRNNGKDCIRISCEYVFWAVIAKLTLHRVHVGLENGQTNLGVGVVTNGDCDTAI